MLGWPDIETALSDCPVFGGIYLGIACQLFILLSPEKPHWPNADVMLAHRLWRWANIIPTLSL